MKAIIINTLLACAVGMALFVTPGCSTSHQGLHKVKIGMDEHETMLAAGRPQARLVVGGMPTYMWCKPGMFGSDFKAVHFLPVSRTVTRTSHEILTTQGDCKKYFRVWGDMLERVAQAEEGYAKDEIEMVMEKW